MKLVINGAFGGFRLSDEQMELLGLDPINWYDDGDKMLRQDPRLIDSVASGNKGYWNSLQVVEIPDNSFFIISEYDGAETVYYSATEIKAI